MKKLLVITSFLTLPLYATQTNTKKTISRTFYKGNWYKPGTNYPVAKPATNVAKVFTYTFGSGQSAQFKFKQPNS